jgi:hypothetical protein
MIERRRGSVPGKRKPAQHEPVGEPVVGDDRIALRIAVAQRALSAPKVVLGERSEQRAVLVVNRYGVVDRLDEMIEPDVAVRIGRPAGAALPAGA